MVGWLLPGHPARKLIEERFLRVPQLHAQHLIDLEVTQALRRLWLRREYPRPTLARGLDALRDLRLTRFPHGAFLGRVWELRESLIAYDASYVALATTDGSLARASGPRCEIELIG